jgi:hypothetical protein
MSSTGGPAPREPILVADYSPASSPPRPRRTARPVPRRGRPGRTRPAPGTTSPANSSSAGSASPASPSSDSSSAPARPASLQPAWQPRRAAGPRKCIPAARAITGRGWPGSGSTGSSTGPAATPGRPRPTSRQHAAEPGPGPAADLLLPRLPAARRPRRPGPHRPLRPGRPHPRVQFVAFVQDQAGPRAGP